MTIHTLWFHFSDSGIHLINCKEVLLQVYKEMMTLQTFCGHLIHQNFDRNGIMELETEQIRQT
jgi:hypothetical protein